jgi:hypothetical protein
MKKVCFLVLFLISIVVQSKNLFIFIKQGEIQRLNVQKNTWHPIRVFDTIPSESTLKFGEKAFLGGVSEDGISFEIKESNKTIETKTVLKGKKPRPELRQTIHRFIESYMGKNQYKYFELLPLKMTKAMNENFVYTNYKDTLISDQLHIRLEAKYTPANVEISNYFDELIFKCQIPQYDSTFSIPSHAFDGSSKIYVQFGDNYEHSESFTIIRANQSKVDQILNSKKKLSPYFDPKSYIDRLLLTSFYEKAGIKNEGLKLFDEMIMEKAQLFDIDYYFGTFLIANYYAQHPEYYQGLYKK